MKMYAVRYPGKPTFYLHPVEQKLYDEASARTLALRILGDECTVDKTTVALEGHEDPLPVWTREGDAFEGGRSGGDYQASDDISVRYFLSNEPHDDLHAMITDTFYVEDLTLMNGNEDETPEDEHQYGVTCRTEFMVCTDLDDPGGSELWTDYEYDTDTDVRIFTGEDAVERATKACRDAAARSSVDMLLWDGRSRIH